MFLSVPKPNAAIIADVAAADVDNSVVCAKPESLFGPLFFVPFWDPFGPLFVQLFGSLFGSLFEFVVGPLFAPPMLYLCSTFAPPLPHLCPIL